jgi:hypothetical protein
MKRMHTIFFKIGSFSRDSVMLMLHAVDGLVGFDSLFAYRSPLITLNEEERGEERERERERE